MLIALLLSFALQQAPRDTPAAAAAAPSAVPGGTIKGRVVAADTGTAVRRAIVTIGAPGVAHRTIYTDAAGRYEASNLPPGSYTVLVRPNPLQAQFLPPPPLPALPDGSIRRVALASGQTIEWYDLTLPRAGAIVGRVVDEHGDPVSGVSVRPQRPGGGRQGVTFSSQSSDEFGRYRVFLLEPGEYELVAKAPMNAPDQVGGSVIGFVDTYHPGALSREQSSRIRVRGGQDTTVADLQLISARLIRVRGIVVSSQAARSDVAPMVMMHRDGGGLGRSADAQGRFAFDAMTPGTYKLTARLLSDNREATLEYASMTVTLDDTDLDLVVTMKPTVTVSGRVVLDGSAAAETPANALTIGAETPQRDAERALPMTRARVGTDMSFTLRNLAGELLVRPSGTAPNGWSLKTVLLGNEDITDVPREFRPEDSGRIQVILTNRWAELTGSVTDDKGKPASGRTLVLFGEDPSAWFAESSRLRATNVTREGTFRMQGLRPGRYHLAVIPSGVRWDFQQIDKAMLEKLAAEATPVVIGEDERRQVDLKLPAGPGL